MPLQAHGLGPWYVLFFSAASLDLTKIEQLGSFGFVHDFVFPVWFLLTALTFVCLEIRMQYRRYFTKGSAEMLGESVRLPLLRLLFALRCSIFRVFDSRIFRVFGCSVRLFGSLVVCVVVLPLRGTAWTVASSARINHCLHR